jgi:hypothetical protein
VRAERASAETASVSAVLRPPDLGPSIPVDRVIPVSQKELWVAISTPGNLEPCHPFCARNPVRKWPGVGSLDEVHYLSGWVFERRFRRWIEGTGYDLEIGPKGGRSSFVEWRILPGGDENCTLRITVHPSALRRPLPVRWPPVRWFAHRLYVRPMLEKYLSSVTRGFEWHLTRGEAVPRNQFGEHRWFS